MSQPKTEAGWARHFAKLLGQLGHQEAAKALLDHLKAPEQRKLPRGVYEKVPGSGDYWIRYADPTGKIRRQHIGRSLAAARDIAEQRRTEVRQGRFNPDTIGKRRQRMTVKEMFDLYLPLRTEVRNKTEDQRYAHLWTKAFGSLELDELTPLDLEKWRSEQIRRVKPSTVNRAMEYLRAFYYLAVRDEHCQANPVAKLSLLQENNERTRFLTEPEEAKLSAQMQPADFDLVLFAIHSGMRRGEQFGLRWEEVDQDNRFAKIPRSKAGRYRIVHLNDVALAVLERQRARAPGSPWVFPSRRNPSVPRNAQAFVQRAFDPALEAARIEDFVWHDLRRTFASRLAIAGQPLNTIGDLLGHSTPAMTKRYSHLSPGHLREAVETLHKRPTRTSTDTHQNDS